MRIGLIIILLTLNTLGYTNPSHPFYVSITELSIKNDTLQISIRVFSDDLEMALNEFYPEKSFLDLDKASFDDFKRISGYLRKSFSITPYDTQELKVDWLGHEFEDDVCWIYGDVPISPEQRILFIKNGVLMDLHETQQNLVHFNSDEGVKTEIATKSDKEVRFIIRGED